METKARPSIEPLVNDLLREHAQVPPPSPSGLLGHQLTLRGDLAIDSLALVSLTIRMGEALEVDVVDSGLEFGNLQTVGDLLAIAEKLVASRGSSP